MTKQLSIVIALLVLVLASLACGTPVEEWQTRGWTVTPSPTSSVILPTQTPFIVEITATPLPPTIAPELVEMCVVASENVYLRPSPEATYYPLDPIPSGTKVIDTGTRKGNWAFVQVGENKGWINLEFLGECK